MPATDKPKKKHRSNREWIERHINDPFVKAATKHGYRARSAYKLTEIDDKDRLIRPGIVAIDLGASPGSWCQVLRERMTARGGEFRGRIVALDLLPMEPVPGVDFIQGDFREQEVADRLAQLLAGARADLILSDMAPNLSGLAAVDSHRSAHLVELALEFARVHLKPEGSLLLKAFQGSGYSQFVAELKRAFRSVATRKPAASRAESAETYLLARGLKQPALETG
jgi:23S rRNA (uridine2552-2'-O)-methyltransferase